MITQDDNLNATLFLAGPQQGHLALATAFAAIREAGRLAGMEQAAVIAGDWQLFGPRNDYNRGRLKGREEAAAAIRAAKEGA